MNKNQKALNKVKEKFVISLQCLSLKNKNKQMKYVKILQELVDKATPKKLKNKTDKDGRLLWVCPTCGDVYMKFWSDVETISCRKHCDNCGQKLDWSDNDE